MSPDEATASSPNADFSRRKAALTAGIALLVLALLAPFAYIFVLQNTIVEPRDATATVNNIIASEGLFRASIAALLIVIILDIVVAWAIYILLRPVNYALSVLVAWLRLAYAAVFAVALSNLLDALRLLKGADYSPVLEPAQLNTQVMSSLSSFQNGYDIALAIFGIHLLCLGFLVFRSGFFPKFLGILVIVAGVGYLIDTFAIVLVPDYSLSVGQFTFVGEALLIVWLFWRGIKGFPTDSEEFLGEEAG